MLRILPHFFFFKEGAPFVVIPAYCTTTRAFRKWQEMSFSAERVGIFMRIS